MRAFIVLLIGISAAMMSQNLESLLLEEISAECSDLDNLNQKYGQWSEVLNLFEMGQIGRELDSLREIQLETSNMIATNRDVSNIDATLRSLQTQFEKVQQHASLPDQRQFLTKQSEQIKETVEYVCSIKNPDKKKSSLAMLVGLLEYIVKEMSKIEEQCQQVKQAKTQIEVKKTEVSKQIATCKAKQVDVPKKQPEPQVRERIKITKVPKQTSTSSNKPKVSPKAPQKSKPQIQSQKPIVEECDAPKQVPETKQARVFQPPKAPEPECEETVKEPTPEPQPECEVPKKEPTPEPECEPKKEPTPEPECDIPKEETVIQNKCIQGGSIIFSSGFDQNKNSVVTEIDSSQLKVYEFGFGVWIRYLTLYPAYMQRGLEQKEYFIAGVSQNEDKGILSVSQLQNAFYFESTHEDQNENKQIPFTDIEGVWVYIYFGHNGQKATGFIQLEERPLVILLQTKYSQKKGLKFTLGGLFAKLPGFNGQITRPVLRIGRGSYLNTVEEFEQFTFNCNPIPVQEPFTAQRVYFESQFHSEQTIDPQQDSLDVDFANQYSIEGWFKWESLGNQQKKWHTIFRLAHTPKTNAQTELGERVLGAWVGSSQAQIHFASYTYRDMKGSGKANVFDIIKHEERHLQWHYIYFGYDRSVRQAIASVQFGEDREEVDFELNHYLAPKHYLYLLKEKGLPAYNGLAFNVVLTYGPRPLPPSPLVPAPKEVCKKPVEKKCVAGPEAIINAGARKGPVVQVQLKESELKDTSEYGYGYWFRYLQRYPTTIIKREAWSSMSELISTPKKSMKDGLLTVFQGVSGYFFSSANSDTLVEYAHPFADIEGVWTYVYISYTKGKVVGFIGQQNLIKFEFKAVHQQIKQLTFRIAGGDTQWKYVGFNGQFSNPVLRLGQGSFLSTEEEITQFTLSCNPMPNTEPKCLGPLIAVTEKSSTFDGKPLKSLNSFSQQYSVAGWFKINSVTAQLFLLTNIDRDILLQANVDDQKLVFKTHSNGEILTQQLQASHFLDDWIYIDFQYSRQTQTATVSIQHVKGTSQLTFQNVKHYLNPEFILTYGSNLDGQIYQLKAYFCNEKYTIPVLPKEQCAPKEPVCLQPEQYDIISLKNFDAIQKEMQQRKTILQIKKPMEQKCYCFQ